MKGQIFCNNSCFMICVLVLRRQKLKLKIAGGVLVFQEATYAIETGVAKSVADKVIR